jgi:hypothetical protein
MGARSAEMGARSTEMGARSTEIGVQRESEIYAHIDCYTARGADYELQR